jgi:hypothetical protein
MMGAFCMLYLLLWMADYQPVLVFVVPRKILRAGEFPRCVQYSFDQNDRGGRVDRLKPNAESSPLKRVILNPMSDPLDQQRITDSREYTHTATEEIETDDCKAQYQWQLTSYPTCNLVHEFDLGSVYDHETGKAKLRIIAHGYWRDVWVVREEISNAKRVLKTLRYQHEFHLGNQDRHRRDALAMERLTKSNFVVDIYGYCSNSGAFEYGEGGDVKDAIWPRGESGQNLTQLDKLQIGKLQLD